MALKDHKKTITRLFLTFLVMTLLCFGVFSCTTYLEQERQVYVDMSDVELIQLDTPADDAPAMKMHTTMGDIVAELYPEEAPDYVAQFTELAQSGYYDDTYVFSVEEGVYFEAGSGSEDGSLPEDSVLAYERVDQEISVNLWPFRGAFCVPTTTTEGGFWDRLTGQMRTYCGTRFVVCNTITFDAAARSELDAVSENAQAINDAFLEYGGIPNYAQQMTIFAQAYGEESFATIDAITSVTTQAAAEEGGYTPPMEEIRITSIEIGTYGELTAS